MNLDKRIVLPGEMVFDSPKRLDGTFVEGGKTFASLVSIRVEDRVVPLKGFYLPQMGDYVIGVLAEKTFNGFIVDINSPYFGELSERELREGRIGDVVSAKIALTNEVNEAVLVDARRLWGGEILEIEHVKVPRVIGKNASMLQMLKNGCGCDIFVGKNGRIYLKNGDTALAGMAILKICREAHTSGLTDRIAEFLAKEKKQLNESDSFAGGLNDSRS